MNILSLIRPLTGRLKAVKTLAVFLPLAVSCFSSPCYALPPPIGYVGPAPLVAGLAPPVGYIGPVIDQVAHTQIIQVADSAPHLSTSPRIETFPTAPVPSTAAKQPSAPTTLTNILAATPENYNHKDETLIAAQQMHSDSATNIITATGKVEIVRGDYVLHADTVTYNQKTAIMTADGHVAILTPTGEVEFAQHEEITGDMKQAFGEQVGILFPDNSRMAARNIQRFDERYSLVQGGAYTACNICKDDPEHPPTWQLRADTITHDNVDHVIYYHNATVDLAGVPVAFTPYLSGPDPTVKRLTGFLSPQPGYSPNIGASVKVPYYIDIAPDKDAILTPDFSQKDKVQLAAEYRERFVNGSLQFNGSIANADLKNAAGVDKGEKLRGNAFGFFHYDLDHVWRMGTDVQYASDQSYLSRYQISSLDQTITHGFVQGLQGRNYTSFDSYYFQDLRVGTNVSEPIILPSVTVSRLGDPGAAFGGRWSFDGNSLATQRSNTNPTVNQNGFNTRRLSMNGGWQRQMISDTGLETTISGLVRSDSYWANNVTAADSSGHVYNQALYTRPFAQANTVVRYPMGRSGDGYQQIVEPIVAFTAAPEVRLINKQPNEDSIDVEFDETNLFAPNRFTGSDLIEGGNRATYGLRNAITTDSGGRINLFGGESYDFTANNQFPARSGLNAHASDYVGRIDFAPASWFDANYGFRLAQSDLSPQRQDALVSFGAPIFRPSVRYLEAYQTDTNTNLTILGQQATLGFTSHFADYWNLSVSHTQSFAPQPGPRNTSLNIAYIDECLAYGITLSQNDTTRQDIASGTSATFHINLKNLGGFGTDSVSSPTFPTEFRQTN